MPEKAGYMYAPGLSCLLQLRTLLPLCPFPRAVYLLGEEAFQFTHAGAKLQAVPPRRGGVEARTCNVRFQQDGKSKLLNTGALKPGIRNPESGIQTLESGIQNP